MTIAVLIPAFNPGPHLQEALQSVLMQDIEDLDVTVVDDASVPPITDIMKDIRDPRLHIERNTFNRGLSGNWNRCLDLAAGDPILIFHQDDRMLPGYLARASAQLKAHPDAGFVFCNIETIDADGRPLGGHWAPAALPISDRHLQPSELAQLLLSHGNVIPCQTVVVRAAAFRRAGAFDPRLGYALDLDMWLRIARHWGAIYLASPMVQIRRHKGQESTRYLHTAREVTEVRQAFLSFLKERGKDDPNCASLSMTEARHIARRHLQRWTLHQLRQAVHDGRWTEALRFFSILSRMLAASCFGAPC